MIKPSINKNVIVLFFLFLSYYSFSQTDTIKLMTYNVGDFGTPPTTGCPLFNFGIKSLYLRTIIKYENPDILGMAKINGDQFFCTDSIVNYVLDSVCNNCWEYGAYTQLSGYPKENMLYFKTNKIGFVSSTVIYSADNSISDITLHKLYYKSPNLATTHDTTFIKIVLAHLKSGSGSTSQRGTEIAGAMSWLNSHITANENLIFMGDFNTTASTETCFQNLIGSSNSNTKFYDPPNQLGNWAANPNNFANYLTQSTRITDPGDCNATGGLNNRFDHILITSAIKNGTDSVSYIPASYQVVGQDGNHTNKALLDAPTNTSIPSSVDSALYYMSEHLPVTIKMQIKYSNLAEIDRYINPLTDVTIAPNPFSEQTRVTFSQFQKNTHIQLISINGVEVKHILFSGKELLLKKEELIPGIYFLQITNQTQNTMFKKLIIN